MSDVIIFRPKAQVEAERQLREFIALSQKITGFDRPGEPLNWGDFNWSYWLKGVNFAKLGENVRSKAFKEETGVLDASILDFAKAYVLYQQSLNRTADVKETVAIQLLEASLLHANGNADVTLAVPRDFDRAAELCLNHFSSPARAYRIGGALEKLASFLSDNKLTKGVVDWVNVIPRPNDARGHRKNKELATRKMPTREVLDAIGEIWSNNPESPMDTFVTSNCVILLSQPGRAGELNLLPNKCLPPEVENVAGGASGVTGAKVEAGGPLFIKWFGEKGFGHTQKLVPKALAPYCVEAIKRIRKITEGPRKLAKFIEEHPEDFPDHDLCPKVSQDSILTPEQVIDALCLNPGRSARQALKAWLKRNLNYFEGRRGVSEARAVVDEALAGMYEGRSDAGKRDHLTLTLRKLNVVVRARYLPPHFPFVDEKETIKYQDVLNCYFVGQLGEQDGMGHGLLKPYMIRAIDNNTLNNSLTVFSGEHGSKKSDAQNIFRRWGYIGDQYKLTTHQFRHYLNTLAARGSVGETELARWSGRLDISQNKVYNHRTDEELTSEAKSIGLGEQSSNLITVVNSKDPILASDLGDLVGSDRVAHRTLMGVCIHDFAMEPCQRDRDCLTCKEHVCVKGDRERLRRIKLLRDGLKESLKEAQRGVENGYFGADKWVTDRLDRLKRANELIALLEDPGVEDGAVITCTDNGYLPVKKALEANGKLPREQTVGLGVDRNRADAIQDELRALMGV